MKEYIDKELFLAELKERHDYIMQDQEISKAAKWCEEICFGRTKDILETIPAADVVSKGAFDQVAWERDVAIQQLREDYGVGLGEKKAADVVERKRGEWVYHECVSSHDGTISGYSCSNCNAFVNEETFDMDEFHKDFCGHCGADMRSHHDSLCDQTEEDA